MDCRLTSYLWEEIASRSTMRIWLHQHEADIHLSWKYCKCTHEKFKDETVGWFSLSYHRSQNLDGDSSQTRPPSQGPPQLGIEEGVVLVWQHSLAQWLSCLSPFLKILSSKTHNYWFSPMVKRSRAKESQNQQVLNIHVKEKLKVKDIMSTLESEVLVFQ